MQEMIELSKLQQEQPENPPRVVSFLNPNELKNGQPTTTTIQAGPAQFGLDLKGDVQVQFTWREKMMLNIYGGILEIKERM